MDGIAIGLIFISVLFFLIIRAVKKYSKEKRQAKKAPEPPQQQPPKVKATYPAITSKQIESDLKQRQALIKELQRRAEKDRKAMIYTTSQKLENDLRQLNLIEMQIGLYDREIELIQSTAETQKSTIQELQKATGNKEQPERMTEIDIAREKQVVKLLEQRTKAIEKQSAIMARLEESGANDMLEIYERVYPDKHIN